MFTGDDTEEIASIEKIATKTSNKNDTSNGIKTSEGNRECAICFDDENVCYSVGCDHFYCSICWDGYLRTEMVDPMGQRKYTTTCPENNCLSYVTHSFISKVASQKTIKDLQAIQFERERPAREEMERYRKGYPGLKDDPNASKNLEFFQNKRESTPNGSLIDVIHKEWFGDYEKLERHHSYVQWLFPFREKGGMNRDAQPLMMHEANVIKTNPELQERAIRSYELMLDFYGMVLTDKESGELKRSDDWIARYRNIERNSHNNLRITRILKFLGEVGLEHFQIQFAEYLVDEIFSKRQLLSCEASSRNYWIGAVRNDEERARLTKVMHHGEGSTNQDDAIATKKITTTTITTTTTTTTTD